MEPLIQKVLKASPFGEGGGSGHSLFRVSSIQTVKNDLFPGLVYLQPIHEFLLSRVSSMGTKSRCRWLGEFNRIIFENVYTFLDTFPFKSN